MRKAEVVKVTIRCPRPYCGGRVFVEHVLTERGLLAGTEARCFACSRVFTDQLTRIKQQTHAA